MKHIKDLSIEELRRIDFVEQMTKFISENWDGIETLLPKGWDEMRENYDDYEGMEDIDEKAVCEAFGICDTHTMSLPFPVATNIAHVMYDATNQGRNPLYVLLRSAFNMGREFGLREAVVNENSEANKDRYLLKHHTDSILFSLCGQIEEGKELNDTTLIEAYELGEKLDIDSKYVMRVLTPKYQEAKQREEERKQQFELERLQKTKEEKEKELQKTNEMIERIMKRQKAKEVSLVLNSGEEVVLKYSEKLEEYVGITMFGKVIVGATVANGNDFDSNDWCYAHSEIDFLKSDSMSVNEIVQELNDICFTNYKKDELF